MKKLVAPFFLVVIFLIIFKAWLGLAPLTAGDWHYFYTDSLSRSQIGLWGWDFTYNNGFGESDIFLLGLNSYFLSGSAFLLDVVRLPWVIVERLMWFWPYLLFSTLGSWYVFRQFEKNNFWVFSALIFACNSYTLLVIGGGQMGVAMAISLTPAVAGLYMSFVESKVKRTLTIKTLLLILLFGLQVCLDLRIACITALGATIYSLFFIQELLYKKKIVGLVLIGLGVFLLNAFWIVPQTLLHSSPFTQLGPAYTSLDAVRFFSFAKFENTLGFLQPNWPENIFGKSYFMRPEFLLLPLLAFSSLLFVKKGNTHNKKILAFAAISLIGIFLGKGSSDPFGAIYLWLFSHVPGFVMFRDSTKWYLLIVLGYSVLIPYTMQQIYYLLKKKYDV